MFIKLLRSWLKAHIIFIASKTLSMHEFMGTNFKMMKLSQFMLTTIILPKKINI